MYKDKDKANEAAKERMRRYRSKGVTEGVTQQGVTQEIPEGVTGLITDELGYQYKVLTDGQRWYPGNNGYHPEGCACGIEHKLRAHQLDIQPRNQ